MTIAVDFDGTIVTHQYPAIGEEIPFAIESLIKLQKQGHKLILWSVREGALLEDAIAYCKRKGLVFYAVNKNYPEEETDHPNYSRKLQADIFIDDRNVGGMMDWGLIYRIISRGLTLNDLLSHVDHLAPTKKKKSFWSKLLGS